MKVAIEARALSAKGGGVKTYVKELITHLLKTQDLALTVFLDHPTAAAEIEAMHEEVLPLWPKFMLSRWLNYDIAARLSDLQPDVVHYTKADVPKRFTRPTVVTVYDVIPLLFPSSQAWLQRWYWPQAFKRCAKADHILTISQASKDDIVNYLQVAPEKVTVTPLAVNSQRYHPTISAAEKTRVARILRITGPYILFVATRDQRKNVSLLVEAFAKIATQIPHQLVIAGKPALKQDQARQTAARQSGAVREKIVFADFVEYADLPALYAGADLFVWPSVYEGWGFPPQEAMASGVPVIVSNGGPLPEVVGSAGEVVEFTVSDLAARTGDKDFAQALSQRMLQVIQDRRKWAMMRQMGLEHVKKFSWEAVAQRTAAVYTSVAQV